MRKIRIMNEKMSRRKAQTAKRLNFKLDCVMYLYFSVFAFICVFLLHANWGVRYTRNAKIVYALALVGRNSGMRSVWLWLRLVGSGVWKFEVTLPSERRNLV